jgi:shikimate kinase
MTSNIILIGFMGCGKSSIGRRLASRLGHAFLDSDELIIEAAGGRNISDIFAEEGEEQFRERETRALQGLIHSTSIVLATGGGAVLRPQNREILRKIGTTVWLHADPDTLYERATRNRKRPLLEVENPRTTFNELLQSRLPVYAGAADLTVDASGLSHEQTVEAIVNTIGGRGGGTD